MKFTKISIIYNPNSSGNSKVLAKELQAELRKRLPDVPVECLATKRPGHAVEIASRLAKKEKRPLIISSSGDGGYNEVVNGIMKVPSSSAVSAVLPAGNANDHSRTMSDGRLADSIVKGRVTNLDLLKISISGQDKAQDMVYAHSYAGIGLTPVVAAELNRHSLNAFREMYISIKTFFAYRPFKIRHQQKVLKLDSILFANINKMAKVLTLSPKNRPQDGKFELIVFPSQRKWHLLVRLTRAVVSHIEDASRVAEYTFTVLKKMPMQADGELITLPAGSTVKVKSLKRALKTIV